MTATTQQTAGLVRVLLIGDPPAVDAAEKHLRTFADVEVIRNPHTKQVVVRAGFDWVVVMNARGQGAILKEAARRAHARFLSVPPNWSGAEATLRGDGFFKEVERRRRIAPLTSRPLAALALRGLPEDTPKTVWVCSKGHTFPTVQRACPRCAEETRAAVPPPAPPTSVSPPPAPAPVEVKPTRPERPAGLFEGPDGKVSTTEERETVMRLYVKDHPAATHLQIQRHLKGLFGVTIDSYKISRARMDLAGYETSRTKEQVRARKLIVREILLADVNAGNAVVQAQVRARGGTGISAETIRHTREVILRARAWAAAKSALTPKPAPAPPPPASAAPSPPPASTPTPAPAPAPAPAEESPLAPETRAVLDLLKETLTKERLATFTLVLREDGRFDVEFTRRIVVPGKVTY